MELKNSTERVRESVEKQLPTSGSEKKMSLINMDAKRKAELIRKAATEYKDYVLESSEQESPRKQAPLPEKDLFQEKLQMFKEI